VGFDLAEVFDSFFPLGVDQVAFVVVTDFFEVKNNFVITLVLGQDDAAGAVGDVPSDAGFTDGDFIVRRHLLAEPVSLDDLILIQTRQQRTEPNKDEGGEDVESEAVARFHLELRIEN